MKQHMSQRDEEFSDYRDIEYRVILLALERIDADRSNLIRAQNNLVKLLNRMKSAYTIHRFREFYSGGGVTAADWEAYHNSHKDRYVEPQPIKLRQLRVVGEGPWPASDPVKRPERYRLKKCK